MAKQPNTPARPVTLTETERFTLARLESLVDAGVKAVESVLDAGRALREIRDSQLYRDSAESWESYVKARFSIGRRRADQLVAFATVKATLDETGTRVPEMSEKAARPLVGMDAGTVAEVVAEAAGTPEGVTASSIRRAAAKRKKPGKVRVPKPWRSPVPGAVVAVALNAKGVKAGVTVEAALLAALAAWRRQHGEGGREAA